MRNGGRTIPMLVAACLAASACGGDGHVASASGTPTGTGTGTAPSYDSFAGLNRNVTLQTTSTALGYHYDTINGTDQRSVTRDAKGGFGDGGITIGYDAASQTYTVHDGANAIAYAPADRDVSSTNPSLSPFDTYARRTGNLVDTIQAYRAGSANTQYPQLSYTTFVIARRDTVTGQSGISQQFGDSRLIYAIGGFETVRSDLPKTGTASYSTFVAGGATGNSAGTIAGTATVTADFAAASVSTALALTANGQALGTFSGVAPIEAATPHFRGDLTAGGATQGSFSGSFFGPQGTEVGYTYRVQTGVGTIDGGVVGKK